MLDRGPLDVEVSALTKLIGVVGRRSIANLKSAPDVREAECIGKVLQLRWGKPDIVSHTEVMSWLSCSFRRIVRLKVKIRVHRVGDARIDAGAGLAVMVVHRTIRTEASIVTLCDNDCGDLWFAGRMLILPGHLSSLLLSDELKRTLDLENLVLQNVRLLTLTNYVPVK